MGNIKSHLIDYGYNLDFSYDDDLCSRELVKHLGKKKYIEFCSYVESMMSQFGYVGIEEKIRFYIGKDDKHLKILLSGQILISAMILEGIIESLSKLNLNSLNKLNILEMGGYDGWSSDYLNKNTPFNSKIDVIDIITNDENPNKNIQLIKSNYKDFISSEKYDVIFSILGVNEDKIEDLIQCVERNIKAKGYVLLGLRIQPEDYRKTEELFTTRGYELINKNTKTISVPLDTGLQTLPLFEFHKI